MSGRAGTIVLMLKYDEAWGCRRAHLANLGCPDPPLTPGGDAPGIVLQRWVRILTEVLYSTQNYRRHVNMNQHSGNYWGQRRS